jgi:3-hydroxyisobutyrate dehydrogenase-like beta-hydroxyacid dehydrogenase
MTTPNDAPRDVTLIGLGMMGTTLARLLLTNGYGVTVWNRTPEKVATLVREGAILASDPASAIAASPIVVVCVYDYKATEEILRAEGVASALAGRVLIQLTTGSPQEARDSEIWARKCDAAYLDGAIQAAPSQMGRPDTPILVSGPLTTYQQAEPILKVFGGNITYLGEQIGAASAMDYATLSCLYGALLGFFHGARICEAEGFPVDSYASLIAGITPTFGEFLQHEGKVIHSGDFTTTESPLRISVEATERIAQAARQSGINAEFPTFLSSLFQRANAAGYGNEELAAVIKVLRQPP